MLVKEFENKLKLFDSKKINLKFDYDYYVKIGQNGKRCHLSNNDKSVEKLSNGKIKENDNYSCYIIEVNNIASNLVKKKINSFYKVLIIIKIENCLINDYVVYFPKIDDEIAMRIKKELFNE